jgi:hypothetical protein
MEDGVALYAKKKRMKNMKVYRKATIAYRI